MDFVVLFTDCYLLRFQPAGVRSVGLLWADGWLPALMIPPDVHEILHGARCEIIGAGSHPSAFANNLTAE